MTTPTLIPDDSIDLVQALQNPSAYPGDTVDQVEVVETHISWVFLTKFHAYKVKKSVRNEFLDYSTLQRRRDFCIKELELNRRYSPELYLEVVPIARNGTDVEVGGSGRVVEYAVKMQRFPADALLSEQLSQDSVEPSDVKELSERIARFHGTASQVEPHAPYGEPKTILQEALQNLNALESSQFNSQSTARQLVELRAWTGDSFKEYEPRFELRKKEGWVRECHGDLHSGNVVIWKGKLTPFDGIEFNESFRWIDVLSDLAFLAMDLRVRAHQGLSNLLINTYLESSGDYSDLLLWRWYTIYRALVRAKVASLVMSQHPATSDAFESAQSELRKLLAFAVESTQVNRPTLSITYGLSGSGKSTVAEEHVWRYGAIRVRADVERKRIMGLSPQNRPTEVQAKRLYSSEMSQQTYERLFDLTTRILAAGYSVVVDATFLQRNCRERFANFARMRRVPFQILDCQSDLKILKRRIIDRGTAGGDPSDADLDVLALQVANQEPLDDSEKAAAVVVRSLYRPEMPDAP